MAAALKGKTLPKKTVKPAPRAFTTFDDMLLQGVRKGQLPARSAESRKWFRDTAKKTSIKPNDLMREDKTRLRNTTGIGKMYMFFYDPKHKETLPFYDRFPIIFPIESYNDGFLGINFHYLPPRLRAKLMDALYDLATNDKYDDNTKLKISYNVLKAASRYKYFRPCIKRYLTAHVRSRFMQIHATEWDMALFLPVERFEKASKQDVWRDSEQKIRNSATKAKAKSK